VVGLALLASGLLAGRWIGIRGSKVAVPSFRRLTFRRGRILSGRFSADGKTIAYAASWEGAPAEIFTMRSDSAESRSLGLVHADLMSVSSKGELAVRLETNGPGSVGTLARIPLGGGTPRELLEDVYVADWSPNGEDLAVVRRLPDGRNRLEYPLGSAIY